ncbi:HNH endonuclease signature motif containing protein [Aeromicrobium endophyticum]|uniref:HNH endonuclease n=1 Tax=Aeromicrobium endophyticum TaxID=2292704 RepID=A0A371PB71_9ACTN|nr:HNH endonuclease signature motif containing protein [Aeromicrobium endophyticum]REK72710.1 HNH endonuclease [Aeromicrobium endophyticum]
MATTADAAIDVLTDVARARARGEFRELAAMLEFRDLELERIDEQHESAIKRFNERGAIALEIGEAMGFSEGQVQHRLSFADTVRDHSPTTWAAFGEGRVDLARVREIGHTISQLKRAESVHRLDRRVVEYAETHTVAELRAWLKRFVRRVEADLAVERADDERAKRHVSFQHGDDSMGFMGAYAPSHEIAAVEDRIRRAARRPVDADDQRTVAQREADLLMAWLLSTSSRGEGVIDANIAVTVDADVLAGANPGFAESADGRWGVPAQWIADVVGSGSTFWHRIVVDPVDDDVLAHEYVGRFAPDVLNIALRFLYGTCQGPGCMVPAERCDIDHRTPFPEGPTRGDNLGPLCRRHHTYKGHGILHWSTRPEPATPAA